MGSTSRAIVITKSSTNELKLIERPTPQPRRGEVQVNVRAASLNSRDSEIIRGTYHTRYARSLQAARIGGHIYVIGYLGGTSGEINPLDIFRRRLRVHGISVGSHESFEAMNRAMETARLQPVIDRVFAWTVVSDAIQHLDSQTHVEKVVLHF